MAGDMIDVTLELELLVENKGIQRWQRTVSLPCIPSTGDWVVLTTNMDGSRITPDPSWLTVEKREFTVTNGRCELIILCDDHSTEPDDDESIEWLIQQGWREVTEATDGR